ncbi:MAG: HAMP domain-containing histidine kinase [Alphaproteobacteria bacterium]|nr:HAMP domain-containing histidine kinase [Alphaproteobacteria bacterium]MBQ8557583.1 HAMP domain-containing histidine kinase [Alphaproteobacteria bacterium]
MNTKQSLIQNRDYFFKHWHKLPCCRAFNQLNIGVVFTINGIIQFANQQMGTYLKQQVSVLYGKNWQDVFSNNTLLITELIEMEKNLYQQDCCCFTMQKSIFPLTRNHHVFRIMCSWVDPQNKPAGICWFFQDITSLISRLELAQYERTSMRVFELLRDLDENQEKHQIFYGLIQEILQQYRLKTALFFEHKKKTLICSYAVGNNDQFPYMFQSELTLDMQAKESTAYKALTTQKVACCSDISQNDFYRAYLKYPDELSIPVSTCAFPVIINRKVEGVISLYSYDVHFFSHTVIVQLRQLIREICLYIEELRIKQKHQQSLKLLQHKLENQIRVLEKNKSIMQKQMAETNKLVADLILARNQAEVANKSKMNFLANISHELRTPLNAILGFAQVMTTETFGPINQPQYKEYISFIQKSAYHLLGLINDILDLSRVDSGKMTLNEEPVHLKNVLQDVLDLIAQYPNASQRHIALHFDGDVVLLSDERVLRQIFLNVLSNAIKFTETDGHIDIFIENNETGMTLIFQDDGIGIPPDKLATLFQPFTQIENVLTRSHQGSGLGLVLVKKMVILHQGTVRLESEEKKGTKLIIHFPKERIIQQE